VSVHAVMHPSHVEHAASAVQAADWSPQLCCEHSSQVGALPPCPPLPAVPLVEPAPPPAPVAFCLSCVSESLDEQAAMPAKANARPTITLRGSEADRCMASIVVAWGALRQVVHVRSATP